MPKQVEELGLLLACPEHRRPELEYAMEFVASALGVRLRACTPGQRLNGLRRVVVAGDVQDLPLDPALELVVLAPCRMEDRNSHRLKGWIEPGPLPVFGEHRAFPESDRLPWRYRDGGCPLAWTRRGELTLVRLGFDPLGPVFHWLARIEELRHGSREHFLAARAEGSWMEGHGLVDYPWIDRLVQFFENLLDLRAEGGREIVRMPRWPGGRKWAACLSHDVDMLFKWRLRSGIRLLLKTPLHLFGLRLGKLARMWGELLGKIRRGEDPWFLVDEMIELEERRGLLSTFLFLAESRDHRTFRYHLDRPQVRALLERVRERGRELALHAGWGSLGRRDRLQDEKVLLERLCGGPVSSVRQHWLRFDRECTWTDQSLAGFSADSSLGWNDRCGFRAGTSLPFRPWDLRERRAGGLLELPLSLMDSQLYDEQGLDPEAARARSEALLEVVRRTGGLLTVNWHPHTLCREDFPGRAGHYEDLLALLVDGQAHVDGIGGIAEHWTRREYYRRGESGSGLKAMEHRG